MAFDEKTQNSIIRQSSLKSAVDLLKEKTQEPADIIKMAKTFEEYVHYGEYISDERKKELEDIAKQIIEEGEKK